MANKHILSLEIPTVANCEIFRVKDTSEYTSNLYVDCEELLITPPGYNEGKVIKVKKGFDLAINSCSLGIQTTGCSTTKLGEVISATRSEIPDGIYIIRYSISPNDKVYVEYNVLRITTLLSAYHKKLCDLDLKPCEPTLDRRDVLNEMSLIRTMIDAAKAKVEYCQSPHEGMELYNFAKKKLNKITCDMCC